MEFEEIKENRLKKKDYLWRYLSLHKLLYLLCERKLYFSRLDLLPDPLEGVSMRLIHERYFADLYPERKDWNSAIPLEIHKAQAQRNTEVRDNYEAEFNKQRRAQYVNCWFRGNRESMAMWEIYSNSDSVAIKLDGRDFIDYINRLVLLQPLLKPELKFICGDVKYYKINPPDLRVRSDVKYMGLKKDVSYDFEREYRMLIITQTQDFEKNPEFKTFDLPKDFLKMIEIVTHPLMEKWKFENIKCLCNVLGVNNIQISKIKMK